MENIAGMVYNNLMGKTDMVEMLVKEHEKIAEKIKSGKYSADYVAKQLSPADVEIRAKITEAKRSAISGAMEIVEAYEDTLRTADDLNPADITDDAKLFHVGVKLTVRDVEAILSRNKDNATMTQLALRYAEEHGIKVGKVFTSSYEKKKNEIEGLKYAIESYGKWIDTKDAKVVLNKYFNISDEN